MNVKEVATITGVSVRTLRHYDKIGLLCPKRNCENGYRDYSESDLDILQQILFFKKCGFPLIRIKKLLENPDFDKEKAFDLQKKHLLHEKKRIDSMLNTLNNTLKALQGEITMTTKQKFEGFNLNNNPYEEEARKIWGDEVIDKSNARIAEMDTQKQNTLSERMSVLFMELAKIRKETADSEKVHNAMHEMFGHFNANYGFQYTKEAFADLGQVYITDQRFTDSINQFGDGLAQFLAQAMRIYAEKNSN